MSYQPPGPYPVFPQYRAPTPARMPKPPRPQTVVRAHYCILAGGALSVLGVVAAFTESDSIRTALEKADPTASPTTINSLITATVALAVGLGLIELGLWVWMAFATKAGKNWARVTSTVFFACNAASTLFGTIAYFVTSSSGSSSTTFGSAETTLGQVAAWLEFLAGLAAIILLWNKASTAYFRPMTFYPGPYGYPGGPQNAAPYPYPYAYPVMPQQGQQQAQQQWQQPPQQTQPEAAQPSDPWGTPPQD
jgi:hypothetical protein